MSSIPGVPEDHILVVVQLSGGNDGLNTVVPFADDNYYRVRPGIGIRERELIELQRLGNGRATGLGLHPKLAPIKDLYDEGMAAVVQGVGYPNPNRSHFKSMDIWQTADTSATGDGWIGRYFDSQCCGEGKGESGQAETASQPGIAIGRTAPLAMQGRRVTPIAFETPDLFRWTGEDVHESLVDPYEHLTRTGVRDGAEAGSNAAFLMRTALDAQVSSELIRNAVAKRPLVNYPGTPLGKQLAMVGSMIRSGLDTRVYYVVHGGFDTHAGQGGANGQHAQLLDQFAQAVRAFYSDLNEQGNAQRVLTMSFSEFGRRVGQNASGGTDHGTAAPMFLFGPMVNAGVIGDHPSLTDLDSGDLKYMIDFRRVYADILRDWMGADPRVVLDGSYRTLGVLRT
jgi:uncharacterized protein (DUF1501 family)